MRPFLLPFILLLFLVLTHCNDYSKKSTVPFFAQQVLDTLRAEKQPTKIELDLTHNHLYWLNKMGEIYRMQPDGTQVVLVNKGFGADIGITYIKDFSLDAEQNRIYFTDLFDLESGSSAIKQSDLNGNRVETITTFDQEIAIQVASKAGSHMIYYVTQEKQNLQTTYRLGAIQEGTWEKRILYTSAESFNLHQWSDLSLGSEFDNLMMASQ